MKKTITSFSPRAAMMLLATFLLTLTAQTVRAQNPTTYADLVTAINNVTPGGTVTLGGDINCSSLGDNYGIEVETGANFTLDLNSYTLKGSSTNAVLLVETGATLTITDGAGGGSIVNEYTNNGYAVMNSGTVTISGGTFSGRSGLCNSSGGTMAVSGGTISCSVSGNGAAIENNATLTVDGGTLIGTGGNSAGILNGSTANVGACTIKGCGKGILNTSTLNLTALPTFGSGTDANDCDINSMMISFSADITAAPVNPIVVCYNYDFFPSLTFTNGYATHCSGIDPADMFTYYGGATTNIIATLVGDEAEFKMVPVSYIDANGVEQTLLYDYFVIDGSKTSYQNGDWYVVNSDVTLSYLSFNRSAEIILCDGAKLTVKNNNVRRDIATPTDSSPSITIYAQSAGTGAIEAGAIKVNTSKGVGASLTINGGNVDINRLEACNIYINGGSITATTANNKTAIYSGALTQINGGNVTVTANGCNGIVSEGEAICINSGQVTVTAIGDNSNGLKANTGDISINGGQVTANATGTNSYGMSSSTDIHFDFTNATDFIRASNYNVGQDCKISIANGKTLYDETGASYTGDLNETQIAAIAGKMLMPEFAVVGNISFISSAAQLKLLASRVNGGNTYSGTTFKLNANISFDKNESNNFTPIGNRENAFSGTFDGQEFSISGIRISDPDGFDKAIFSRVVEGTVKNLVVSDCRIEARNGIGGIVAQLEGKIENCQVGSDVTLTGNMYVGGIAAGSHSGVITGCTSAATITGTNNSDQKASYLGGIAGATLAGSTLTDNLFLGTIGGDLNEYIGAITGYDDGGNTFTNNAYTCEDYKGVGTAGSITGTDVAGTRKLKNIATCSATVPNPIYHSTYTHSYFYDGTWNDNHGGIEVYDGETLLTYGTDYRYKMMESLDGGNCENLNENCRVYLEGLGDYTGELYRDVVIVPATVTNESWGSLTWSLDADGNFTISGTGAMNAATTFRNYTWYNYCSYFKTITIGEGITTVAAGAFGGDSNTNPYTAVTTVNLPSTLTTIGDNAFAYCTGLTSLTIPASVTTVGANAFNQCNSLDEVYCFADPFTTWQGYETAFKTDPDDSNNKTTFYVTNADAWSEAYPTANVTYVGSTPVSYIDENGKEQSCWNYTVLRTNELPDGCSGWNNLPGGWYVVKNSNTNDEVNDGVDFYRYGTVEFKGDAHLILCDGAEMSVSNFDGSTPFQSSGALTIYGQSGGTGRLSVTNTHYNGNGLEANCCLTINGGIISVSISATDKAFIAINCSFGDVVINGGTVTATVSGSATTIFGYNVSILGGTVTANGTVGTATGTGRGNITLGWRTAADRITAKAYNCTTLKIADGQALTDLTSTYLGTLTAAEKTAIANVELHPVAGVTLTKDVNDKVSATFSFTTEDEVSIPVNVTVDNVTIDRTFTADKACTLYLPFSIAASKVSGGKFHTFTSVDETKNPWKVIYTEVTGDIAANTPYIFLPDNTNGGKITVNNGEDKITVSTANPNTTHDAGNNWEFIGTHKRIKWTKDTSDPEYSATREAEIGSVYGFAAVEKGSDHVGDFVKVGNNVFINPMRAYLKKSSASPARAKALGAQTEQLPDRMRVVIVSADGTSTEIGTLDTRTGEISLDEWYSLDGRRLSSEPTQHGVYIHNGKKVMKK